MYSTVDGNSDHSKQQQQQSGRFDDGASIASSLSRAAKNKFRHRRGNSDLSQPLTVATSNPDEELGAAGDPFFVFRSDLIRKLEFVDEALAEYLRVVHDTVRRGERNPKKSVYLV
jgi:hypothetical protein